MDGRLSFVEQGRESKRPGSEVEILNTAINNQQRSNNARAPEGQTVWGRHFLGYFFVAYTDVGKGREQERKLC